MKATFQTHKRADWRESNPVKPLYDLDRPWRAVDRQTILGQDKLVVVSVLPWGRFLASIFSTLSCFLPFSLVPHTTILHPIFWWFMSLFKFFLNNSFLWLKAFLAIPILVLISVSRDRICHRLWWWLLSRAMRRRHCVCGDGAPVHFDRVGGAARAVRFSNFAYLFQKFF